MVGGACINVGWIPTKILAASAAVSELVSGARHVRIRVDELEERLGERACKQAGGRVGDCRWWIWAGYFVASEAA